MSISRPRLLVPLIAALCLGAAWAQDQGLHHHHHEFGEDVAALHAALAPLWHAPEGKARLRNACAKAAKLEQLTRAVRDGDTQPLLTAIAAMKTQCKTKSGDVAGAFSQVHDAFHHLIEPPRN